MKQIWHLSSHYIWHYKKQSMAIFFGIVLSIGLLSGIGTLIHSGEEQNFVKNKEIYGDWHCVVSGSYELGENIKSEDNGYVIEEAGLLETKKEVEEPWKLEFVYADEAYRSMLGRNIEKGTYPESKNQIALDNYTITNLGLSDTIGDAVILDGQSYELCGIISDLWAANVGKMQVFVSKDFRNETDSFEWYLKFKEKNVYGQIDSLMRLFSIDDSEISINSDVTDYVGGISIGEVANVVKEGLSLSEGKLGYIFGCLKTRCNLLENGILLCIGLFGSFVIYSIFSISIHKRLSQYGVLYTLGISDRHIFGMILTELCTIFAIGYPIGCLLGNSVVKAFYANIGTAFVNQNIGDMQAGVHVSDTEKFLSASKVEAGDFLISWRAILFGAILFLILMIVVSFILLRKIRRYTLIQIMKESEKENFHNRKIYCQKHCNMPDVLSRKFMFRNPGTFLGIIISLSIGGIIFLGSTYVIENTKINNELSLKTDDGLTSDMQIFEQSDNLSDVIPKQTIAEIKTLPGIKEIYPVKYLLGEFPLSEDQVIWDSYCAEIANDPSWEPDSTIMAKYNGQCLRETDGSYKMKSNIYGYEDAMLNQMEDYILEGTIDPKVMKQENTVILKTWMGGQGDYDGLDLKPGDTITLKVPKEGNVPEDILRFQESDEWYIQKDFVIAAIVSRPMAKNDNFIGDDGTSSLDIIMTNQQMEENFGLNGYNMASIQMNVGYDSASVLQDVTKFTQTISKCAIKDNTGAIEAHTIYLKQKMYFFYTVAVIILIVSMLHIINSMNYLVLSRRHEFGILRAMGITNSGFLKMMLKEGIYYGIYASIFVLMVYFPTKELLYYFMKHVWLYIMPNKTVQLSYIIGVIFVNVLVSTIAVIFPVKRILDEKIVSELKC